MFGEGIMAGDSGNNSASQDLGQCSSFGSVIESLNKMAKKPKLEDDLSGMLDAFLDKLNDSQRYLSNGIFNTNFAEASLLIQSAAIVYGKKVDILWDYILDCQHRMLKYNEKNASRKEIENLEERMNRNKRKKKKLDINPEKKEPDKSALQKEIDTIRKYLAQFGDEQIGENESWGVIDVDEEDENSQQEPVYPPPNRQPSNITLPQSRNRSHQSLHLDVYLPNMDPQLLIKIPGDFPEEEEYMDCNKFAMSHVDRDFRLSMELYLQVGGEPDDVYKPVPISRLMSKFFEIYNIPEDNIPRDVDTLNSFIAFKNAYYNDNRTAQVKINVSVQLARLPDEIVNMYQEKLDKELSELEALDLAEGRSGDGSAINGDETNENDTSLGENETTQGENETTLGGNESEVGSKQCEDGATQSQVDSMDCQNNTCVTQETYTPSKRDTNLDSGFFESDGDCDMEGFNTEDDLALSIHASQMVTSTPKSMKRKQSTSSQDKTQDRSDQPKLKKTRISRKMLKTVSAPLKAFERFYCQQYQAEVDEGTVETPDFSDSEDEDASQSLFEDDGGTVLEATVVPPESDTLVPENSGTVPENSAMVPENSEAAPENNSTEEAPQVPLQLPLVERGMEFTMRRKHYNEWKGFIYKKLQERGGEKDFDIHEYGTKIIDSFPEEKSVKFSSIVEGQSSVEVCKYFVASLQLANMYNIEFSGVPPGQLANDHLEMKLLTTERHHEKLYNYQAPSRGDLSLKMSRLTSLDQSRPSTSYESPDHPIPSTSGTYKSHSKRKRRKLDYSEEQD